MAFANKTIRTLAANLKNADLAFWFFVTAVVLLPIGFGGNRPLPFGLAQVLLALSGLYYVKARKDMPAPHLFLRLRWALGLLALVVVWAWMQTQNFMPSSWLHPFWREAADILKRPVRGAIAVSPEDSLDGLNRLVTYIAVGLLAYVYGQESRRARQFVQALWLSGVVLCFYGLVLYVFGVHKILWMDKWAYENDLTSTFVNRNHFAIYADLVLTSGVALLIQSWREKAHVKKGAEALRLWLQKEGLPKLFFIAIVFVSVILSHSRAGLVLAIVGPGSYIFFYQLYLKAWRRAVVVVLMGLIVLGLSILLAWHYSDRFSHLFNDYSSFDRLTVYKLTMMALHDNPWLGYGLNGFQAVYRLYERDMTMEFVRAHSDWLESLLDLGIPMGLVLWAAIGLLASGLARGIFHRRRNGWLPTLGLATGMVVLMHGLIDFSLQIPGVVFPWAALIGFGLAQSWRRGEKDPAQEVTE